MNEKLRVLIVEDSEDDALLLINELKEGGFEPEFERVDTEEGYSTALNEGEWDVVISDYSLPKFSGLIAIKLLKKSGVDIPFILVSDTIGEEIAVESLRTGAHDFIIKGKWERLVPAIKRELKDAQTRRDNKLMQEALRKSEARFQFAVQGTGEGLWDWDILAGNEWWSDRFRELIAYEEEDLPACYESWKSIIHPDDYEIARDALRQHLDKHMPYNVEYRIKINNGGYRWFLARGVASRDETGKPVRMAGSIQDINKRKKAEERLRQYKHIVSSSTDMMALIDKKFIYIAANQAYLDAFGKTSEEIIGHTISQVFSTEFFETVIKPNVFRCLAGEEVNYQEWFDFPFTGLNYMDVTYSPYRDNKNDIQGFVLNARNITQRKKMEEALKSSLQEKELLLREVHHRVKNNLQVVSHLLQLQSEFTEEKKYLDIFRECQNRIETMSLVHEHLYQSESLSRIDFCDYVKTILYSLLGIYGRSQINIELKVEIKDVFFEIDTAIPCGLIINEVVSNSLKYAFPTDRHGEIIVALKEVTSGGTEAAEKGARLFELSISDSGVGIPRDMDIRKVKSLGLRLTINLAEKQLMGSFSLNRDQGTKYKIIFNEIKYKERVALETSLKEL